MERTESTSAIRRKPNEKAFKSGRIDGILDRSIREATIDSKPTGQKTSVLPEHFAMSGAK